MKVNIKLPVDTQISMELMSWLDREVGSWQDGHWKVRNGRNDRGEPVWVVECDDSVATLVALRWG